MFADTARGAAAPGRISRLRRGGDPSQHTASAHAGARLRARPPSAPTAFAVRRAVGIGRRIRQISFFQWYHTLTSWLRSMSVVCGPVPRGTHVGRAGARAVSRSRGARCQWLLRCKGCGSASGSLRREHAAPLNRCDCRISTRSEYSELPQTKECSCQRGRQRQQCLRWRRWLPARTQRWRTSR